MGLASDDRRMKHFNDHLLTWELLRPELLSMYSNAVLKNLDWDVT